MSEERKQILAMLSEGKISVDEADRLLSAVGTDHHTTSSSAPSKSSSGHDTPPKKTPKYLRVVVETTNDVKDGKTEKVNIKVPLKIIRAGVKLAALLPNHAQDQVNEKLKEKGLNLNLSDLNAETIEEFVECLGDFNIDVNEGGDKVRLFCE